MLRRIAVVAFLHLREQQGALRTEKLAAISEITVKERVFPGRSFPGGQGRRAIGHKNCPEHPVPESQRNGGRILYREISDFIADIGIDFLDLAADMSQVVDLVDQIDQDRPAALFLSPGERPLIIGFRFQHGPCHGNPHQPTQLASGHDLARLFHKAAESPLMSHQHPDPAFRGRFDQAVRIVDALGNGFFNKKMQPLPGAVDPDRRMEMIWRGDDDPLQILLPDHFQVAFVKVDPHLRRDFLSSPVSIRGGDKVAQPDFLQGFGMGRPHQAQSDQTDSDLVHLDPLRHQRFTDRAAAIPLGTSQSSSK